MEKKTMKDVLSRAAKDPEFARQVVNNPAQFKEEFHLTDEQLASISGAGQAAAKAAGGQLAGYENS